MRFLYADPDSKHLSREQISCECWQGSEENCIFISKCESIICCLSLSTLHIERDCSFSKISMHLKIKSLETKHPSYGNLPGMVLVNPAKKTVFHKMFTIATNLQYSSVAGISCI
jgi:hypothetical protein